MPDGLFPHRVLGVDEYVPGRRRNTETQRVFFRPGRIHQIFIKRSGKQQGLDIFLEEWEGLVGYCQPAPQVQLVCPFIYKEMLEADRGSLLSVSLGQRAALVEHSPGVLHSMKKHASLTPGLALDGHTVWDDHIPWCLLFVV